MFMFPITLIILLVIATTVLIFSMATSAEEVTLRINECVERAVVVDENGDIFPHVCVVCDHLLKYEEDVRISTTLLKKRRKILQASGHAAVTNPLLIKAYDFSVRPGAKLWMHEVLLSPRANYRKGKGRGSCSTYSCCHECKTTLNEGRMPVNAIANKHVYGCLPRALEAMNEVEWGLLTPVKGVGYGYTFVYTGGFMKKLKGVLAYQKVDENNIAHAVLQLEALGLNGHIVTLFTGQMTPGQKAMAKARTEIRVDVVMDALEWLAENNDMWKHVRLDEIRANLERMKPTVIDESETIDGAEDTQGSNIETTRTFAAYFPDGSMKTVFGGQATIDDFRKMVEKSQTNMADIKFHCDLMREYVPDYKDNNFVRACMMQMPFGTGGMQEERYNESGKISQSIDLVQWVRHLSKISMPRFHNPLFVLILQSVFQRQLMMKRSRLKVRGEHTQESIANHLNSEDIEYHARARTMGNREGTQVSKKFFECVDAVTGCLPHTDGAAATARNKTECLVHHYGFPNFFLTFTPDDANSHLLQIFSGVEIDDGTPIGQLSDEKLAERCKERHELRIDVPGLSSHMFEIGLDIVMKEVLGLDPLTLKPSGEEGHFGKVRAALVTVEEQGRATLHAHILLWVEEVKEAMSNIQQCISDSELYDYENNRDKLVDIYDRVSTTELIGETDRTVLSHVFSHECTAKNKRSCDSIESPSNQQLRNLRHKAGCIETEHLFAHCRECHQTFNHEDIVKKFLQVALKVESLTHYPESTTDRLKAMCVEYQKSGAPPLEKAIINAAYNTHLSTHTSTCWKKGAKSSGKNKRKRTDNVECRMRNPDMRRQRTRVNVVSENAEWYNWSGAKTSMQFVEVAPKRAAHDEFQNVSIRAVSESKLTCNTNVQILSVGPIVFYVTKYCNKSNQRDDTEDYKGVSDTIKQMLGDKDSERKHDDDKKEAQRRILRAAFRHNTQNVMGAPMASWITRHGTKFRFSHEFVWCPLRDMNQLLSNAAVEFTLKKDAGYVENFAFHYFCRGKDLEHESAFDFYSLNEVVQMTKKNEKTASRFINTPNFKHPSTNKSGLKAKQGSMKREKFVLLKIRQWEFLDAAKLGGDLLDENSPITLEMEKQARLILILFLPHRINSDLMTSQSHTLRLRKAVRDNEINSTALETIAMSPYEFLNNLQDSRANCKRNEASGDELERTTLPWVTRNELNLEYDDEQDEENNVSAEDMNMLLDMIDSPDDTPVLPDEATGLFNNSCIRNRSRNRAGHQYVTDGGSIPVGKFDMKTFMKISMSTTTDTTSTSGLVSDPNAKRRKYTKHNLVKTVAEHRGARHRHLPTFDDKEEVRMHEANGTARSIVDWAVKSRIDKQQRRTFEILASTFVLTFYDEATVDPSHALRTTEFIKEHNKLKKLSGRTNETKALIAFVHGPGGSGKTTVVDMVKLYGEEFCEHLGHPFTNQTIVVTAITGVAATILLGETTDRALHLNHNKIDPQLTSDWVDTRLLVVDEVSFTTPSKISKIDECLRILLDKPCAKYGGMNVVFAGDLRQLQAVKQPSIIDQPCPEFDDWVNCYIELEGLHRFKDDKEWGRILIRFRDGVPTLEDFAKINERVITDETNIPQNIKYATHRNSERDAINAAVFESHCVGTAAVNNGTATDSVLVFSDNILIKTDKKHRRQLINRSLFWQGCGEDDVTVGGKKTSGRVDPVLKLFHGCEVMLTKNESVREAKANGTRAIFREISLKHGEEPFFVQMGDIRVPAVYASSVKSVTLEHVNKDVKPSRFSMEPKKFHATANIPTSREAMSSSKPSDRVEFPIELFQVPVVSNSATTGHKLQGSGVDNLLVSEWFNEASWIYVILSRVKTRAGLFLRHELKPNIALHKIPDALRRKVNRFKTNSTRPPLDETDYADICAPCHH